MYWNRHFDVAGGPLTTNIVILNLGQGTAPVLEPPKLSITSTFGILGVPSPLKYGSGGERNILQSPAPMLSTATAHKTFGPIDLKSTYSVCTGRVFGGTGIEYRHFGLESDALTTRLSTAPT
ncbi:hypothetical protein TNCV_1139371 [Trichonephila clavipes]|nr:hypothetical protein TNCV_1139371 [Trichonephila clavipes]